LQIHLAEILTCPVCVVSDFLVHQESVDGPHIMEGELSCKTCDRAYPIRAGVPRMLPDSLLGIIEDDLGPPAQLDTDSASTDTMHSFGYQWNTFSDVYSQWKDDFFDFISPVDDTYFAGKSGLDVGCGMGRYTRVVGELGTEIIGMDLSNAVEAAFVNTRHLPNVHIVQGDIHLPPFRPASFDFVYSLGVLHHLPEPRRGFDGMRQLTRAGGGIILWVYSDTKHPIYTFMRKFTLRLSFRVLRATCLTIAVMLWLAFILPNKLARAIGLDSFADRIKFQRYARFPFRALHTDLFDEFSAPIIHGHNEPEIRDWFQSSDCSDIVISPTGKHGWRAFGKS
jgi:SAM-dependent methyltransferase/uncharacterized protein YbaR (Trm112 family)